MTKMTDAFKKVFLGLGGNPKELAENNDVGDYIVDLESAIKDYVNEAATHELPTPAVGDIGKVVSVVSDGESGAEYDLTTLTTGGIKIIPIGFAEYSGGTRIDFPTGVTIDTILTDIYENNLNVMLADTTVTNMRDLYSLDMISGKTSSTKCVSFTNVSYGSSKITAKNISYDLLGNWSYTKKTYTIQA